MPAFASPKSFHVSDERQKKRIETREKANLLRVENNKVNYEVKASSPFADNVFLFFSICNDDE